MCTISTPNLLYKDSNLNRYLNKTKQNESISCKTLNNKNDTNKIRAKINNFMLWKKNPLKRTIGYTLTVEKRLRLVKNYDCFSNQFSQQTTSTRSNHSVVWHLRDVAWCWWFFLKNPTIWHFYVICRQTKIQRYKECRYLSIARAFTESRSKDV